MSAYKKTLLALLALGACLALAPAGATAAPAPAWKLTASAQPTNFAPGAESDGLSPVYFPVAYNLGAAPTTGLVTIEIELPAGLTAVSADPFDNDLATSTECEEPLVGPVITCTTEDPVQPGNWVAIKVGVDVSPTAVVGEVLTPEASVFGGDAGEDTVATPTLIDAEPAPFEVLDFDALVTEEDGAPATQAGSHPTRLTVGFGLPVEKVDSLRLSATEHPREIVTELPRGLILNPAATPVRCTEAELTGVVGCPIASQVGTVTVTTLVIGSTPYTSPVYNMVPAPGEPASLGFDALGIGVYLHLTGSVRSDGDYGLTGFSKDIPALGEHPVLAVQAQLWGDPTGPVHDEIRACPKQGAESCPVDPSERTETAFITMPSECSGEPPVFEVRADSWEHPGVFKGASEEMGSLEGDPVTVGGCNQLAFEPEIDSEPTTNLTDSPSGLRFDLHQPQDFDIDGLSSAALRDALVTLPQGMAANPSQANGLEACSPAQVGLMSGVGASPAAFNKAPVSCPDAAKLGEVVVSTPLLEDPLPSDELGLGAVYLAEPFQNPFGSLLAIYIVLDDPKTDTVAKLAGKVIPNPDTGQLSTLFEENPQLPLEDVELELFEGARAPLRTPLTCGDPASGSASPHATFGDFTPWSSPEGANALASDSFTLSAAPGGGPCAQSPGAAPHAPSFNAGTLSPQAGAYSPFVMRLSRADGSQEIGGLETTMPAGLSAKLKGVPNCPEAAIAAAIGRGDPNEGALELASPSCPAASELGTVEVAAGAGPIPYSVQGRAYLAGPYKSAPLSLVIVTPAIAGPFDLGTVVVRAALNVNEKTAQVHAVSDPLPRILEGIPLDLRSAYLRIGRQQFTLNPTSCDPMSIAATATSTLGAGAALSDHFQVGGCKGLPFKPRLKLRLRGGTRRGAHPKLQATLTAAPGEANIARASVALPRSEFLDQAHIRTVCTRVQFAAEQCPAGAIYGHVRAFTPLLEEPLEGPVYLRSSDNELPDTVAVLKGPPSRPIQIEVSARIDSFNRGIRANFEAVPDAPVEKVVVTMQGGRKGLLINSANLCKIGASKRRAIVKMDGQNGKVHDFRPLLANDCKKKKRNKGKRARHR